MIWDAFVGDRYTKKDEALEDHPYWENDLNILKLGDIPMYPRTFFRIQCLSVFFGYPNVFQNFFLDYNVLFVRFFWGGWVDIFISWTSKNPFPGEGSIWMNFSMVSVGYNDPQKFHEKPTSSRDRITAEMMTYKIPDVKLDDLRFAVLSWNFWTLGIFIKRHFSEVWELPSKKILVFDIFLVC